jgi:glutamate formiminotransferase
VKDETGKTVNIPGSLKCVKAIGWYIEEYGIAQISMNLTNLCVTPIHVAFDEACKKAIDRGDARSVVVVVVLVVFLIVVCLISFCVVLFVCFAPSVVYRCIRSHLQASE